ncbi:MAG: sigma-54-dependent Fis family transcriptional regulator [Magnetococcales bacterium]|nr:sigma-54-dependent Fis family transcriptional regulator [Magnetococcales bacterium]MBF0148760.1 sigma-54-dependent Fis family transcriptional regulator [Magnetococcales bacterium]MBF0174209.1 sigma-54-dependent Fis family transcriptional regulator [Magnetococcales bacterium]MBF0348105.1 sigma-54-dependent Fis family transcriptional regulator [Magnetococcales bacterium]MBF0629590.1 sigma-54-dependent Fis family transcriptional regulator [Magnetococcales bacterium]
MKQTEKRLLGESPEFLSVLRTAGLLAPTDATVLISGESGTGKELIARHIAHYSRRARGPWIAINCAALPESLVEAELFGHVRGAFTGASERRLGRIQSASGGTLFLDEISELPLTIQPKLLRLLENNECQMVGRSDAVMVDVRIIAATNANLMDRVRAGLFRSDLFFRLNVVPLELPPLRRRQGDVALLLRTFFDDFARRYQVVAPRITETAFSLLLSYAWPGNIRELRNFCEQMCILHPGKTIIGSDLPKEMRMVDGAAISKTTFSVALPETGINLEALEQDLLAQALQKAAGNKSRAARLLGLTRDTFLYRIKKLAIPLQG